MKSDDIADLDWDKGEGLLPAVVQHARTGALLMLGYMNRESLRTTLASGRATFFSRSRKELWTKGATSGNFLEVVAVSADCDADTILVQVLPAGPACHKGSSSCFPGAIRSDAEGLAFLAQLERIISQRMAAQPEGSYTARILAEGPHRLAQKIGEEGVELALAAASGDNAEVLDEAADLLFHLTLLLRQRGMALADVVEKLELRHAKLVRGADD